MKSRYLHYGVAGAAMLALVLLVFVSAPKAQAPSNAKVDALAAKPTPKMADGHPDFTGFWLSNVAGLSSYADDADSAADVNLTRTADGSLIFLYGGPQAEVPNQGPVGFCFIVL